MKASVSTPRDDPFYGLLVGKTNATSANRTVTNLSKDTSLSKNVERVDGADMEPTCRHAVAAKADQ